ncbi:hypothetical protein [Burkholderia vietnamiensis]|uniref:hypothetical protein n=1 Tax=Burkholderia vietnamiensis TaxID=60552 RepID=UPI0012D48AD5|nr:hypothetical protein [Burkholderia vietnamiensis]MCA8229211.1 hypothetical protein [Burkholderia vietnamiensis]
MQPNAKQGRSAASARGFQPRRDCRVSDGGRLASTQQTSHGNVTRTALGELRKVSNRRANGYMRAVHFVGRDDEAIATDGYRIGPRSWSACPRAGQLPTS